MNDSNSSNSKPRQLRRGMFVAVAIWTAFGIGGLARFVQQVAIEDTVDPVATVWASMGLGLAICFLYVGLSTSTEGGHRVSGGRVVLYVLIALVSIGVIGAILTVIGRGIASG